MQISNTHESIIVKESIGTRFIRNVLEAVEKTRLLNYPVLIKPDKTLLLLH